MGTKVTSSCRCSPGANSRRPAACLVIEQLGNSEVEQLDRAVGGDQDVRGLDVAMNYQIGVGMRGRLATQGTGRDASGAQVFVLAWGLLVRAPGRTIRSGAWLARSPRRPLIDRKGTAMQWTPHRFMLGLALASLTPALCLTAQQADPALGTWTLNIAKSKYNPGPAPKSVTVTVQATDQGAKTDVTGTGSDGTPIQVSYTAKPDGKDYPVTGSQAYDALSVHKTDAWTRVTTRKKGGKVIQTARTVYSKDGKTMTVTTTGVDAKGQKINNVTVFDKK